MNDTGGTIQLPAPSEIAGWSAAATVEYLAVLQRDIARLHAVQVHAVGHVNQVRERDRTVPDELAPELGTSRRQAERLVDLSDDLLHRLPCTLSAMERGDVDLYKAGKIADVTAPLPDETCREVDAALDGRVAGKDPTQIRRIARDLVHRIDADGANERAVRRREDRKLQLWHEDDATATLVADLPAETAAAIYSRVDAIARTLRGAGENRTLEQLRTDVFTDLLLGKANGLPAVQGTIFLHVPIGTALGVTDHGCELEGHGPIPGAIARQIMHNPTSVWRTVLTDPGSGAIRDLGRTRRRPPAALAELVRVRDRECRMWGCHRPAHHSDLDHAQPWRSGGHTSAANLHSLCRRHNQLKEMPGWRFQHHPDTGELTITTPAGRTHHTRPEPPTRVESAGVEKTDAPGATRRPEPQARHRKPAENGRPRNRLPGEAGVSCRPDPAARRNARRAERHSSPADRAPDSVSRSSSRSAASRGRAGAIPSRTR